MNTQNYSGNSGTIVVNLDKEMSPYKVLRFELWLIVCKISIKIGLKS